MQNKTLIKEYTSGSISRKLIAFAVPIMLANLMQVLYNVVDMVAVGRIVGSSGLSAVSNGGFILNLATVICMGISFAGQVLISQYVGAKDTSGIKKTVGTMFSFLAMMSVVIMVLGLVFIDPLLRLINMPAEAYAEAREYCSVCFIGLLFIFGYNTVSAILRGMGDSKRPLIIISAASVLNLILDIVFVGALDMGVKGAATATVIAQGASCAGSIVYLYFRRKAFGFDFKPKSFIIDSSSLLSLLKLGIPMVLQYSAILMSALFVTSWVNSFGVIASAATAIGTKTGMIASIVTGAFGSAGAVMIGQNFGAGQMHRISRIIYISLGWGLVFSMLLSLFMILFPQQIFGLFNKDPEVLAIANEYVIIAVLNYLSFALRSPMMALMQGTGNGKLLIFVGIMDGVVARVGLSILLGITLDMGIKGFWYGNVFAGYIPFIIGGIYFWSGLWKKRKLAI